MKLLRIACFALALIAFDADAQTASSLAEAVQIAREQTGGRVLSAEAVDRGGQIVFLIKVITSDGRVKTVRIRGPRDARGTRNRSP